MARNKYAKDYKPAEYTDKKGRTRTEYVYAGPVYDYIAREKAEAAKRPLACALLCAWAGCIGAMIPNSAAMHTLYIALPFAAGLVPLVVLTEILFVILRKKPPYENRYFDKTTNNFPAACVILCMFVVFSMAGETTVLLSGRGRLSADLLFMLGALAELLAGGYMFSQRTKLRMQETK